jgi:hypothetical protein
MSSTLCSRMSGSSITSRDHGDQENSGKERSQWLSDWSLGQHLSFTLTRQLDDPLGVPHARQAVEEVLYDIQPSRGIRSNDERIVYCRLSGLDPAIDSATKVDPAIIQVTPGIQAVLRGSHETWEAIKTDFYVPCQCVVCNSTLFVIQDAAYVLCPRCFSIVPLEGEFINRTVSGIGMGFSIKGLMRWQLGFLSEDGALIDKGVETGTTQSC